MRGIGRVLTGQREGESVQVREIGRECSQVRERAHNKKFKRKLWNLYYCVLRYCVKLQKSALETKRLVGLIGVHS